MLSENTRLARLFDARIDYFNAKCDTAEAILQGEGDGMGFVVAIAVLRPLASELEKLRTDFRMLSNFT